MQHDTSVYQLEVDGRKERVVASLLYLRYSKRRYLKFYRAFNRFRMKCFFHEALSFWQCAAAQCVIDNTNLARLRGTGRAAVIVPEMAAFGKQYGFEFLCHEVGHSDRKGGEEQVFGRWRPIFFRGARSEALEDLNAQAHRVGDDPARAACRRAKPGQFRPKPLNMKWDSCAGPAPPHYLPAPYLLHERATRSIRLRAPLTAITTGCRGRGGRR